MTIKSNKEGKQDYNDVRFFPLLMLTIKGSPLVFPFLVILDLMNIGILLFAEHNSAVILGIPHLGWNLVAVITLTISIVLRMVGTYESYYAPLSMKKEMNELAEHLEKIKKENR